MALLIGNIMKARESFLERADELRRESTELVQELFDWERGFRGDICVGCLLIAAKSEVEEKTSGF